MTLVELRDVRAVAARYPLATAFVLSLLIHLSFYQFWRTGKQLGWWQHQATWLLQWQHRKSRPPVLLRLVEKQLTARAQPKAHEIPLTFVEVDPATATAQPPKDAKYYGMLNARAANPDVTVDTTVPKLDGKQDKMVRLENVPRPKPFPLTPAVTPPQTAPARAAAEPRAKGGDTPGDLAKALLQELKKPDTGTADTGMGEAPQRERPRTLVAARAQQGMLAGQKMRQEGGVSSRGRLSLDVKITPFSAYDAAFIAAVQQRWYDLLDHTPFMQRSGKVVLEFRLTVEGRIAGMKVAENEVGEVLSGLCQRAVRDPAPYAKWPSDMRRSIGAEYREVTFTFYYY